MDQEEDSPMEDYGEDPIEKMRQWKIRKNIPTGNKALPDRDSPKRETDDYSPWTKNQIIFKSKNLIEEELTGFGENDEAEDFQIIADRNYECLLDYDEQQNTHPNGPREKLTYWQQARIKEEEDIKKINFETFMIRQIELEAEEEERADQDYDDANTADERKSAMGQ